MRLKIGDDFLDGDNSVIAQTFAVNEIGDIQTQQGGFSNDFTIPLTAKNKSILGFPDNINSASRNPYEKVDATLYDNGVPIGEGYLRYAVVSDAELEASFFSDNVNWFNLLKGKLLSDLDLSEYDHEYSTTNIKAIIDADKTSGHVYPFIYYGFMPDPFVFTVDLRNFMPAIFVHNLVERIFFEAGYKIDGDVINHPLYKRMIIPFSARAFVHSEQYRTDSIQTDTVNGPVAFGPNTVTSLSWVDSGATTITWNGELVSVTVTLNISVSGNTTGFRVNISGSFGGTPFTKDFAAPTGTQEYRIVTNTNILVDNGGTISVTIADLTPFSVGSVVDGSITIKADAFIQNTSTVQMSAVMPKMQQVQLLQYISFLFGAILQTNPLSKTVTWSFFRDIKNNLSDALDWSDKLDISKTREIDFTELLDNYGQNTNILYKEDNQDELLVNYQAENNKIFGEGTIDINNKHIKSDVDLFKPQFAPTINEFNTTDNQFYLPFIPFFEEQTTNGTQKFKPQPRILLMTENISISKYANLSTLTINAATGPGGSVTVAAIPFSWFAKNEYLEPDIDSIIDTLAFDQVNINDVVGTPLIERFLSDYDNILNSMKYLSASLWLTETDIANLDFTIPIYLDRYKSYFYISKIEDFQGRERTTECELVKIS